MFRVLSLTVCLVLAGVSQAFAQVAFEKGWIDVNFGVAMAAESEVSSTRVFDVDGEAAGGSVAYDLPRGGSFDVGGGYMFTPRVGIGVSLAGTAHEGVAGLAISVPHPLYFNASATDATVTNGNLARTEGAWHVHAMVVALQTPRIRIRVFGGPSYFRAEQDVVSSINYDHVFQLFGLGNEVDITTYDTEKSVGTAWGVHAGADVSVFFNRVVGVGAVLRFSRGTADIEDYGGTNAVKVGGVQIGAGLRMKF